MRFRAQLERRLLDVLFSARRKASSTVLPECPARGQRMRAIGEELRVPDESDDAGWKELVAEVLMRWRNAPARSRGIALEIEPGYLNSLGVPEARMKEIGGIEEELRRFSEKGWS